MIGHIQIFHANKMIGFSLNKIQFFNDLFFGFWIYHLPDFDSSNLPNSRIELKKVHCNQFWLSSPLSSDRKA